LIPLKKERLHACWRRAVLQVVGYRRGSCLQLQLGPPGCISSIRRPTRIISSFRGVAGGEGRSQQVARVYSRLQTASDSHPSMERSGTSVPTSVDSQM
jgi:hypothetical protein